MKIFTLLILLSSLLFSEVEKKIEVVPADINYKMEMAQEFSEILYDAVLNAIAEFNFTQKNRDEIYHISDKLLANKEYSKDIKEAHTEIKLNALAYMKKYNLTKIIVMDFSTNEIVQKLKNCSGTCKVKVSFMQYTLEKKPSTINYVYEYDGAICLLSDKTTVDINKNIRVYLNN